MDFISYKGCDTEPSLACKYLNLFLGHAPKGKAGVSGGLGVFVSV